MPKQVADIYCQRLAHLRREKDGETCLNLLYKIALCNGQISLTFFDMSFADESEQDYNPVDTPHIEQ